MNIRAKIFGGQSRAEQPILKAKMPKGTKSDDLQSVAVPREESRRANSRGTDRHRLTAETVELSHEGTRHQVTLVNLSGGGAMISGQIAAKLWDRVDLHLGEHGTIECAVRWIRGDRIGLEFAHETQLDCSDDQRAAVLRDAISRSFPDMDFVAATDQPAGAARQEPGDEQRRAPRHPLIWSGTLYHDYQTSTVRVRNISATGAMLECREPVRVGAEPLLELGPAVSVSGTVTWAVGDQVGLRFHSEFDMALLGRSSPAVAPSEWVRPAYLNRVDALDSPWDPRWQRLSVPELKQELEGFLKR
ncbi:MAG TPA: PilZ domain-containing protein [Sphingomicrobium sp.]|jgi:hypothetical protein